MNTAESPIPLADEPIQEPDCKVTPMQGETESSLPVENKEPFAPPFPQQLDELDTNITFLTGLALRAISLEADCTTANVANRLRLGLMITDTLMEQLYRDRLVEKKGVVGMSNHRYAMLDRGWTEVTRLNEFSSYVGPAPVSLQAYTEMTVLQVRNRPPVTPLALERAMAHLVLSADVKQILGMVASSGRSLFLNGPSGNGKTAMACALANAIPGDLWIPYAIEVDGQIIRVFDSHNHVCVKPDTDDYDRRWVKIRPPLVVVGGELTIETLDLQSSPHQRFYEAPLQVKANGGVLLVDDLGRQRCSYKELLNRWIIPLEGRVDYLTMSTGKKIQVPFEQTVIFATNLDPADIADDAFMRRMGYRLEVVAPTPNVFAEIFTSYAASRGLNADPHVLGRLLERYVQEQRLPRSCEPRDLIERAIDLCKYRREALRITDETLNVAWTSYFGAATVAPAAARA
jgi:hypothetical protein